MFAAFLGYDPTTVLNAVNTVEEQAAPAQTREAPKGAPKDPMGQFVSKIPLGRWGKVEEVGQLALYLCSEDAGFITGSTLSANGGQYRFRSPYSAAAKAHHRLVASRSKRQCGYISDYERRRNP